MRVDNEAVSFYHSMKDATGQAARYLDLLSLYDFEVVHRNGARHMNADTVSRVRPCELGENGPCKQCHKRIVGEHLSRGCDFDRDSASSLSGQKLP